MACQSVPAVLASLGKFMLRIGVGRRTQVVKGEVCKTSMQRFESARRLHFLLDFIRQPGAHLLERVLRLSTKKKKEAENFGGEA